MSFGGIVASALAGREASEIASVVLWNPGINPTAAFADLFGVDQIRRALFGDQEPVELALPDGNTLTLRRPFWESLYRIVPAAEIARYRGPVLMAVGTKDHLVFPQPVSAEAFLSYHPGEHELWTRPVDHGFDADLTEEAVAALVEATAVFLKRRFEQECAR